MANWPTSISTDSLLYVAKDNLEGALNGAINNAVTTITLANATNFPSTGFVVIDQEIIKYTGKSGNDLTGCTRGFTPSSAASHSSGAVVYHMVAAEHHNVLKDEIIAIENSLNLTASRAVQTSASGRVEASSVTSTELGYVSGVTSAIQTQLNGKEPTITTLSIAKGGTNSSTALNNNRNIVSSGGAIVESAAITASRALVSDTNGLPTHSTVTTTELGYVSGVTSALQTQINAKAADSSVVHLTGNESIGGIKTFTGQLIGTGTATNDSASTGQIGEQVKSSITTNTNFPTSTNYGDLTSISLTAGDWDVRVCGDCNNASGVTVTSVEFGMSTTSGNSGAGLNINDTNFSTTLDIPTGKRSPSLGGTSRFSLASTTTVYLKYAATYSGGTPPFARGTITARRVR